MALLGRVASFLLPVESFSLYVRTFRRIRRIILLLLQAQSLSRRLFFMWLVLQLQLLVQSFGFTIALSCYLGPLLIPRTQLAIPFPSFVFLALPHVDQ